MSSKEEIQKERERKMELLKEAGMEPYPATTKKTHTIAELVLAFETLESAETVVGIAGRIMSLRRHGGSTFADIFDGYGRVQLFLGKDNVGDASYELFTDAIDASDFIEVEGVPFVTKRGEKTVKVTTWRILSKAIQAVPSEYFGIEDAEERYRKRYLDLLQNDDLREIFVKKAAFWDSVRKFMKSRGFLEVETPTLEITTGGAEARPFKTHHNDFDIDVYMRISIGELWQKRLRSDEHTEMKGRVLSTCRNLRTWSHTRPMRTIVMV